MTDPLSIICLVLAAIWLLDGLRMRGRLGALHVLTPATEGARPDDVVVAADGVDVPPAVATAAGAWAAREQLDAVDLVPPDLATYEALLLAQQVDPTTYRGARLATGRGAGHAQVLAGALAARSGVGEARSSVALRQLATRTKRFAPATADLAVAPGLVGRAASLADVAAVLRAAWGGGAWTLLGAQAVLFGLMITGLLSEGSRPAALIALALFHLQPLLMIVGTPLRPRDLPLVVMLRLPLDLMLWVQVAMAVASDRERDHRVAARRSAYADLVADGPGPELFEPRSETCRICGDPGLDVRLKTVDLLQGKPGRFQLDACRACGTVFQNPRLSIAGLDVYYRDFYDGLGADATDLVFAASGRAYDGRVRAVAAHTTPRRWLDVGTGHGHFCNHARTTWPEARFDGLDLSDAVEEAAEQGWIDAAWRGLFPELAPELAGTYDVVSMHHYLEHTTDPRAEIEAAATVLDPGGHLLIEVPDPESKIGRLLGRYWVPWFQPQHLHLVPPDTVERLLTESGFEVVERQHGEAHQAVDCFFAALLLIERLGPPPNLPWRRPTGALGALRRVAVRVVGVPFMALGALVDWAAQPLTRTRGWSNGYRVLAVRTRQAAPAPSS